MESKLFCLGLAVGMVGGAILVANSKKVRQMIKEGQEQIRKKIDEMEDKKDFAPSGKDDTLSKK